MYNHSSTRQYLARNNLDLNRLYFHFSASSGDLWHIASTLLELLSLHPHCMILSSSKYADLLRIFIGESKLKDRVIILPDNHDPYIRNLTSTDRDSTHPLPPDSLAYEKGVIRPCHLVMYPYFAGLQMSGCISYFKLLKHALGMLQMQSPGSPLFYTKWDYNNANLLLKEINTDNYVLINPINFSHKSLSLYSWRNLIQQIHANNKKVIFNISRSAEVSKDYLSDILAITPDSKTINIPLHLMALVMNRFPVVAGIDGGGMTVAAGFTTSSCFIVGTQSLFFPEYAAFRRVACNNPYANEFAYAFRGNLNNIEYIYTDELDDSNLHILESMLT